jgi:hypothetical protein
MSTHVPHPMAALLASVSALLLALPLAAQTPLARSVARGRFLVVTHDCETCHSPKIMTAQGPVPDSTRTMSGHPSGNPVPAVPAGLLTPKGWGALATADFTAWAGPWGVSFAANLTPDATGIRSWTKAMFIETLRKGKHMGAGRALLPPMPWQAFGQMSDAELGAIYDYLRSLKPIHNVVPAPLPPAGH